MKDFVSPVSDRKCTWKLTCDFVSSSRETGPGQRREPGHAPGVGPNPSGAQQPIETSERGEGQQHKERFNALPEAPSAHMEY